MTQLAVRQNGGEMDIQTLGAVLVKSGFFADTREQAQAIVKVLAGRELGFGPIASMQGVYIVKANLVGAAIQRSGKYGYEIVTLTDDECELHFYSTADPRKRADGFTSRFTIEDAKKAGILSENYRKFPRNMLFSRALTNGARWYCPEVFNGPIYTPEEMGAEVDHEGEVVALPAIEARTVDTSTGEILDAEPAPMPQSMAIPPREQAPTLLPAEAATQARSSLHERYDRLLTAAAAHGIPLTPWAVQPGWTDATLTEKGIALKAKVDEAKAKQGAAA
jgi:hypothetical protein